MADDIKKKEHEVLHQNINDNSSKSNNDATFDAPSYNYNLPFKQFIQTVKNPTSKRKLTIGSHAYWVLLALYKGHVIDDYENKPLNLRTEKRINNVSQRVFDLRSKYGITKIKSRNVEGEKFVEFYLKR